MRIPGLERLQAAVPSLRTRWGFWRVPLAMALAFLLITLFFIAADLRFPEWMPDGEIVILALGFLILSRFFSQRKAYRKKYGDEAYAKAFVRFAIPGLGIIGASVAHLAYITGPEIPEVWWKPWLAISGSLLILKGAALWFRSVTSLGLDNLVMLYVYQPAEGMRSGSPIYGLLRHPIYAAALDIAFGLALIHSNWYALLVAVLLPLFFLGWIRLVEEPELLERFPDYASYRSRVPALMPRIRDLPRLVRCLLTGRA